MFDRIEIDPRVCGGKPIVRGTRIPVAVLLEQLASGETCETLLGGYPELRVEDLQAVLFYAKSVIERTEFDP